MVEWDSVDWHIEPTSKCTLECPLCDRTWFYNTFKKRLLHEINVDHLVNFLGNEKVINFCGNNGDPIYHTNFIELCNKLKNNNNTIHIVTNGSAKTQNWWESLTTTLNEYDTITFSIDGLEDTNHIYRKNAKWNSIMNAVKIVSSSKVPMRWKFIVFKHNQHQVDKARQLSIQLKFDDFEVEYSDRWHQLVNKFMPDNDYVDTHYLHREKVLSDKKYTFAIKPKCLKNGLPKNRLYIDAEGNFYPCCYFGTYRYKFKSIFSPKDGNFDIKTHTINDILNNARVKNFFDSTKDFETAHECCKIKCGINNG